MPEFRADQPTFAAGEIGEELAARFDTAKYRTALKAARNVIIRPAGGVVNRQGFEFVGELYNSDHQCKLIPFSFSIAQTYVLPFEHYTSRVISNGGFVLETELLLSGISNAAQAVVWVVAHNYVVGDDVFFDGVAGMDEINGLVARVVAIPDPDHVTIDLDTTGFGAFTGALGGVAGNAYGSTGGNNPATPPVVTPPPVTPVIPPITIPTTPPFFIGPILPS